MPPGPVDSIIPTCQRTLLMKTNVKSHLHHWKMCLW